MKLDKDPNATFIAGFVVGAAKGSSWLVIIAVVLVVLGVMVTNLIDDIARAVARAQLPDVVEIDVGPGAYDLAHPNKPIVMPTVTQYSWLPIEKKPYVWGTSPDNSNGFTVKRQWCREACTKRTVKPDFQTGEWTYLLIVPGTDWRSGAAAAEVAGGLSTLQDFGMTIVPTIVVAGRDELFQSAVVSTGFAEQCVPVSVRGYGCFRSIMVMDEFRKDAHYGRFNAWLTEMTGDTVHQLLPQLWAIDGDGVLRMAMVADDPFRIAAALIDLHGLWDRVGADVRTNHGYSVKRCGTQRLCFHDEKADSPLVRFFEKGADLPFERELVSYNGGRRYTRPSIVLGPLDSPTRLEQNLSLTVETFQEVQKAATSVLTGGQVVPGKKE